MTVHSTPPTPHRVRQQPPLLPAPSPTYPRSAAIRSNSPARKRSAESTTAQNARYSNSAKRYVTSRYESALAAGGGAAEDCDPRHSPATRHEHNLPLQLARGCTHQDKLWVSERSQEVNQPAHLGTAPRLHAQHESSLGRNLTSLSSSTHLLHGLHKEACRLRRCRGYARNGRGGRGHANLQEQDDVVALRSHVPNVVCRRVCDARGEQEPVAAARCRAGGGGGGHVNTDRRV